MIHFYFIYAKMIRGLIIAGCVITCVLCSNMILPKHLAFYRDSSAYNPALDIRSNLPREENNFTTYHQYYLMEFCRIDKKFCITDMCNLHVEKLICIECQNFTQAAMKNSRCVEPDTTQFMDLYHRCDASMSRLTPEIAGPCTHSRPDYIANFVFV